MGLDQFAFTTEAATVPEAMDDVLNDVPFRKLHRWRNHFFLHCWMEAVYRRNGGRDLSLDWITMVLREADLSALEHTVVAGRLPAPSGDFFGAPLVTGQEDDLAFIKSAREAILSGKTVFYSALF